MRRTTLLFLLLIAFGFFAQAQITPQSFLLEPWERNQFALMDSLGYSTRTMALYHGQGKERVAREEVLVLTPGGNPSNLKRFDFGMGSNERIHITTRVYQYDEQDRLTVSEFTHGFGASDYYEYVGQKKIIQRVVWGTAGQPSSERSYSYRTDRKGRVIKAFSRDRHQREARSFRYKKDGRIGSIVLQIKSNDSIAKIPERILAFDYGDQKVCISIDSVPFWEFLFDESGRLVSDSRFFSIMGEQSEVPCVQSRNRYFYREDGLLEKIEVTFSTNRKAKPSHYEEYYTYR